MTALLLLIALACTGDKPIPTLDGGATTPTEPTDPTQPSTPVEPTDPWGPGRPVSYTCPEAPADAMRIRLGTVLAHQVFYSGTPRSGDATWDPDEEAEKPVLFPLYALKVRGISYTDADSCPLLDIDNLYYLDVRHGTVTDQFELDLQLSIPGDSVDDFLGEHGDGGGHLVRPDRAAHQLSFGWHDGTDYHWVESLPYGWTRSTVCVGEVSPEFTYITITFDPSDGPYMTNIRNPWTQPLYVEVKLVGTGLEEGLEPKDCWKTGNHCRSCFGTVYVTSNRQDWFPEATTQ